MTLTARTPRYAVFGVRLSYPDIPLTYADAVALGVSSYYGRAYADILTAEGALGRLTRSLTHQGPTLPGGYALGGTPVRFYLSVIPGAYPLAFTVTSVRRLTGGVRLLTGHPGSVGYRPADHEVAVLYAGRLPLGVRRGSRLTLLTDTALGAGYVRVARAGR